MNVYHWQDESGAWHVGANALVYARHMYQRCEEQFKIVGGQYCFLIRHAHTGELEWVPESKLKPYPSEAIPVPESKGGE